MLILVQWIIRQYVWRIIIATWLKGLFTGGVHYGKIVSTSVLSKTLSHNTCTLIFTKPSATENECVEKCQARFCHPNAQCCFFALDLARCIWYCLEQSKVDWRQLQTLCGYCSPEGAPLLQTRAHTGHETIIISRRGQLDLDWASLLTNNTFVHKPVKLIS